MTSVCCLLPGDPAHSCEMTWEDFRGRHSRALPSSPRDSWQCPWYCPILKTRKLSSRRSLAGGNIVWGEPGSCLGASALLLFNCRGSAPSELLEGAVKAVGLPESLRQVCTAVEPDSSLGKTPMVHREAWPHPSCPPLPVLHHKHVRGATGPVAPRSKFQHP